MSWITKLKDFGRCLLGLQDSRIDRRVPPRDLVEFNAAKKRLKISSRAFSREIDTFGEMVYGMREQTRPKKPPAKRKRARKQ